MMENNCENLYGIIGSAGVSVLFIISEIMPFVKSVKSNGILQSIISCINKQKKQENNEITHENRDGSTSLPV